jgi:superfamily I DNA and/or RNA helicase
VASVKAKDLSYGESMFKRLFSHFKSAPAGEKCLLRLTSQFRMHGEIVSFPNRYFYGNCLSTVTWGHVL